MSERNNKRLVGANLILWALNSLYTVSPIDLLPDFIPLLGWADDGAGWLATLAFTAYTIYRLVQARGSLAQLRQDGPPTLSRKKQPAPVEPKPSSGIPGYEPMSYEELRSL